MRARKKETEEVEEGKEMKKRGKLRGDHELVEFGIGSKARGNYVPLTQVIFSPDFL